MNYSLFSKHRKDLMGLATIGVVLCHYKECLTIHQKAIPFYAEFFSRGMCCGDLFMIAYGIGLYYSYKKNQDIISFYKKRLFRILPVYLIVGVPFWFLFDVVFSHLSITKFFRDLFFISFFADGVSIFWFIPAAISFFLLFPFLYKFLSNHSEKETKTFGARTAILIAIAIAVEVLISVNFPSYKKIKIMTGRFPAFIIGIYFGYKSYCKCNISKAELLVLPLAKIIVHFLFKIPALQETLSLFNIHYLDTLLGLLVIEAFMIFSNYVKSDKPSKCLTWFGNITFETYLFHMSLLVLFGNPSDLAVYILICVIIPFTCGFLLHRFLQRTMKPLYS